MADDPINRMRSRADIRTVDSAPVLTVRDLADFRVRRVEWLRKPFWQRACFTLLVGKKGVAKGTMLAGLAAQSARGDLYGEPRKVLVVTSEDSVELDFKPRYLAAGGPDKDDVVHVVRGQFVLPDHIAWLEDQADGIGNVGLIVIDPLGNHLGGENTDQEGRIRNAIAPLNDLADRLDCLLIGVRHLKKNISAGALEAVLGTTAWVDVPRAVVGMAKDDEDPMLVHYAVMAGNRGPSNGTGRQARIKLVDVRNAVDITVLEDAGASSKTLDDLLTTSAGKGASRSASAREMILDILESDGPQESDTLDARVAAASELSARTVRNARMKLANDGMVKAEPIRGSDGKVSGWTVRRTGAPRRSLQSPDRSNRGRLDQSPDRAEGLEKSPGNSYPPNQSPARKVEDSGSLYPESHPTLPTRATEGTGNPPMAVDEARWADYAASHPDGEL